LNVRLISFSASDYQYSGTSGFYLLGNEGVMLLASTHQVGCYSEL